MFQTSTKLTPIIISDHICHGVLTTASMGSGVIIFLIISILIKSIEWTMENVQFRLQNQQWESSWERSWDCMYSVGVWEPLNWTLLMCAKLRKKIKLTFALSSSPITGQSITYRVNSLLVFKIFLRFLLYTTHISLSNYGLNFKKA